MPTRRGCSPARGRARALVAQARAQALSVASRQARVGHCCDCIHQCYTRAFWDAVISGFLAALRRALPSAPQLSPWPAAAPSLGRRRQARRLPSKARALRRAGGRGHNSRLHRADARAAPRRRGLRREPHARAPANGRAAGDREQRISYRDLQKSWRARNDTVLWRKR